MDEKTVFGRRFNELDPLLFLLVPFARWMMLPFLFFTVTVPFRNEKQKDLLETKWSHETDCRCSVWTEKDGAMDTEPEQKWPVK